MSYTENLTIMFTDIADYSRSVARMSRKESEEMLKAHDRILHKVIRQYKGKWIKSIGDSFLVVFRSPTDAALCAMAMHDALWEEMKEVEDESKHIRIRVALNLGEVRLTRNDVFGEAVNIASRLESITPADNIYLTESVHLSMNKAEVLAVKEGSERFKGSPEEVVYYKIPRSVNRRVVADAAEQGEENFDYPFGGAHLKAQALEGDINLETISSAIAGRQFGVLPKVGFALGAACLVAGAAAFYILQPGDQEADRVTQRLVQPENSSRDTQTADSRPLEEQLMPPEAVKAPAAESVAPTAVSVSANGEPVSPAESSDPLAAKLPPLDTRPVDNSGAAQNSPPPGAETAVSVSALGAPISAAESSGPLAAKLAPLESTPADGSMTGQNSLASGAGSAEAAGGAWVADSKEFDRSATVLLEREDFEGLQALVDESLGLNYEDPYRLIVQGHLAMHSSDFRGAIEQYEQGLKADPALAKDSRLAESLVVLLDHQPTRTRALLADHLSEEVIEQLSKRSGEKGMHSRHYAVKLLSSSDNRDKIDAVGMHIWDLRELEKCKDRKISVIALRKLKDPRAVPALKEAISGGFVSQLRMTCLTNEAKKAISEMEG